MSEVQISDHKFCPMPWVHFHADTSGKVKACCSTSVTFGDLNHESVSEIWKGASIQQFRDQVLKEGVDQRCAACLNRERAGKSSMRTESLERYSDVSEQIRNQQFHMEKLKPIYLDIRFSNVCNLRCRTCWHGASSSWFEEARLLNNTASEQAIVRATENNLSFIEELLTYTDRIEEIYFAGGEPLMMEEHYELLDRLIQTEQTDSFLRYNTNLTRLNLKDKCVLNYWKHFTKVELSISVDALNEQGEYIRKGLKWNQLIENIYSIRKECPHVKLMLAPTISVLNVSILPELHRYFTEVIKISIDHIYLNLLDRPNYYNIRHLKIEEKKAITERFQNHLHWLQKSKAKKSVVEEFSSILEYMNAFKPSEKQQRLLIEKTNRLDLMRGESYNQTFRKLPES